jgi:hypothetical protein
MSTFLLCWNPKYWDWPELREAKAVVDVGGFVEQRWSCGTKQVHIGDRLFLILPLARLKAEPAFQPMNWSARQSGVRVPDEVAAGVERAWAPFAAHENNTDRAEDND